MSQGIYYDLLHVCDLAIYCDMYASSFLVWMAGANIFHARTKDERLVELFTRYTVWCKENRILLMYAYVSSCLTFSSFICYLFQPMTQICNAERTHMYKPLR